MLSELYLGIGSNLGDRVDYLNRATALVAQHIGEVTARSRYYESEPKNFVSSNAFLNGALKVATGLEPVEVMRKLQAIEAQLGRIRQGEDYQDRTIDLDILLFGTLVISGSALVIPHPHMHERRFVLLPLAEIAGSELHPVKGKSIERLLQECTDPSWVNVYKEST